MPDYTQEFKTCCLERLNVLYAHDEAAVTRLLCYLKTVENADEKLAQISTARINEIYGAQPPDIVLERMNAELDSIIRSGFSFLYLIAQLLKTRSNSAGYLVSYSGCVGASLVAFLLGITEIDPIRYNIPFETFGGLDDFVKISGLSHGNGTWQDNAENLIKSGVATLSEVIATRDELMLYFLEQGIERQSAYAIMERIRKGLGLSDEYRDIIGNVGLPSWYIGSVDKIQYLFPKAHEVACTLEAFRIAWFKAHHSEVFRAELRSNISLI